MKIQEIFQKEHIKTPLITFTITRLMVFWVAVIGEKGITINPDRGWNKNLNNMFLNVLARWDSGFYLEIIERGYIFEPDRISNSLFFPGYPISIKLVDILFDNILFSAVVVSHVCFLIALVFLYKLAKLEFGSDEIASRTVLYISIFPSAFFFSAVYSESLFLLLSVAVFYYSRTEKWAAAAIFAAFASATRFAGIFLWPTLILFWLYSKGWSYQKFFDVDSWRNVWRAIVEDWKNFIFLQIAPIGLISFITYSYFVLGEPFAFIQVQRNSLHHALRNPIPDIFNLVAKFLRNDILSGQFSIDSFFVIFALVIGIGMLPIISKKLPWPYLFFSIGSLLFPMSVGSLHLSFLRYFLVIFPIFLALGKWVKNEYVHQAIMIVFSLFMAVLTLFFVNWEWAG